MNENEKKMKNSFQFLNIKLEKKQKKINTRFVSVNRNKDRFNMVFRSLSYCCCLFFNLSLYLLKI